MKNLKKGSNFRIYLFLGFVFCLSGETTAAQTDINSFFKASTDYSSVVIERVLSADTFVIEGGKHIQLIGLQAPPAPKRKHVKQNEYGIIIEEVTPESSIEERALKFVKDLLGGKTVRLEFDVEHKSENSQTFAYAFLPDETFVNQEIVRQGYADLRIRPPNLKHEDALRQAYLEARAEKRGIHAE